MTHTTLCFYCDEGLCQKSYVLLLVRMTSVLDHLALHRPTVSSANNSLAYFISMASGEHPVWRGHSKEAKRRQPCGPRITRNCAVMGSLLLPCAPTWLFLVAGWCLMGATPRGSAVDAGLDAAAWTRRAERAAAGGVVDVPRAFSGSPRAPRINAQRGAQFDPYNTRKYLQRKKLLREIQ